MELIREAKLTGMVAAGVSLFVALYLLKLIASLLLSKKKYPPIVGTIVHQFFSLHRLQDLHTELSRRHKTFRFLAPTRNYVFTADPANVEHILKTNFTNYGKGHSSYEILNDLLGDGIFVVDGEKWRHQRKLATLEFSAKVLRDYSSLVFRDSAGNLCELLFEAVNSSKAIIDIQDLFLKLTMDSIFKVGFGVELDTLGGSNEQGKIFAKAFDDSNTQLLRRYFDVLWRVNRFLNIGLEAQLKKNIRLIDDFIYHVINSKIEQLSLKKDDSMTRKDILSRLLIERENDPETLSCKYLRDIVLNFFIAGRDTTASTLSWLFYLLCKHPNVQEKAARVVREAIQGKGNLPIKKLSAFLTEEALNRMHYLHAALTETLRLYPPVPLDAKHCFSNDTLPDGFNVKKGDFVCYQPYAMGRMEYLWGDEAELFRPERWLNVNGFFEPESSYKFTAFQAGPRICVGKDFAYRQMKIVAATLLYYFRFVVLAEDQAVKYRPMLTLQIDGGLRLRASCRE